MEVDESKLINSQEIINFLISNKSIYFKNQSRDETDLSDKEKFDIAKGIYDKSKSTFLARFGKYLNQDHFDFIKNSTSDSTEEQEVKMILDGLNSKSKTKNRRYEALNKLIKEDSYFSENEMMKRNPLLYEQLVGQYLSANEKKERDMNIEKDTLVKILLEGIERDMTEDILKKQMLEEESEEDNSQSDTEDTEDDESIKSFKWGEFHTEPACTPSSSKWGEIKPKKSIAKSNHNRVTKKKTILQKMSHFITAEERRLLKEEFTSIMHQNFLNGKDDVDYAAIDNNDEYDNIEILGHDEEEKYFDSEEPDEVRMEEDQAKMASESSEDELDMYMNALNQHPTVVQLSEDLEKM